MDTPEQLIIPAAEEAAAAAQDAETASFAAFVAEWPMEDMPACPVGMRLLHRFAGAHPTAFALAFQRGFTDIPPNIAAIPRWRTYAEHRSTCGDCNESGDVTYPYDGTRPQVV